MEVSKCMVSKLVYNLLMGLIIYLYRGCNPVTKYHGHPSMVNPELVFWNPIYMFPKCSGRDWNLHLHTWPFKNL